MRKNSVKSRRVNDEVKKSLSEILRDIKDPRVSHMISITMVDVATDLKTCKVWVSVFGAGDDIKDTMEGLQSANGYIRRELAHRVNLRNTPEIEFIADDSIAYGVQMSHRIDEVIAGDLEADAERRAQGINIDDNSAYVDGGAEDR